jgi:hypothetical protein
MQRGINIYNSLLHTHIYTSVHSLVFNSRCSVAAFNSGHSPFYVFPNYSRPQLPASKSNNSQQLNLSSSLTDKLSHSPTNSLNSTVKVKVRVILQLAVYRQWVRLDAKPLEAHDQIFFFATEYFLSLSLCNNLPDERIGLSLTGSVLLITSCTGRTENTFPLVLFMGRYLVTSVV